MIIEMTGVTNSSAFQKLEDESKRTVLKELKVSTEHTEDTDHRNLNGIYTDGLGLLRKKSLGEIFNKNMAYGQKSIIGS